MLNNTAQFFTQKKQNAPSRHGGGSHLAILDKKCVTSPPLPSTTHHLTHLAERSAQRVLAVEAREVREVEGDDGRDVHLLVKEIPHRDCDFAELEDLDFRDLTKLQSTVSPELEALLAHYDTVGLPGTVGSQRLVRTRILGEDVNGA